jgi:hypothetical protein
VESLIDAVREFEEALATYVDIESDVLLSASPSDRQANQPAHSLIPSTSVEFVTAEGRET